MWPLLACSIITLTVILERALFWISLERKRDRPLLDEVLDVARSGDWETIKTKTAGCKDYVIRMLAVGILHRDFSLEKAMEAEAEEALKRMRKFMTVLDTMITVAPLLGIFGTVLGIITSFQLLGTSGIEDPRAVTAGIAQALITTAAGLGIAILAVFPYNYFNARIGSAAHVMEKYATSLEIVTQTTENRDRLPRERSL
ncbi:MAG: MotA/TolQ/ExbB proton channel family protein [Deltaproteobacteria bacterium]|nr:MAG: MotA/TolQ/ExbB proton channel family protein [Deltaproteobacteria bacterium]